MQVTAGATFQWALSFARPKTGWVGIFPPGTSSIFSVSQDWAAYMRNALDEAPFSQQAQGSITLQAPSTPGNYFIQNVVPKDGGTVGFDTLTVVAAAGTTSPPSSSPPAVSPSGSTYNPWAGAPAGVYVPPVPEPAATDGAKLSAQGTDIQAYYVANYGPGMLAATQFVIDHEHQLAAIGSSTTPTTAYTAPPNEPAASDGEKLSMQSADVQTYYVQKYGPGFLAATGFVNERNASLGTSIPGGASTVLPANGGAPVGGAGAFTGGAGGGAFSSIATQTPGIPTAQGQPPPTVGALVQQIEGNKPLLIGLAVGAYFLMGGRIPSIGHRR